MLKNKKGFTLMELMMVILILSTLATIAMPMYRNSARKARVSVNMPLMRSLQNDVVNYYNLNNRLPDSLWQLALDRKDFDDATPTKAVHRATGCLIVLNGGASKFNITEDCNEGWEIEYGIVKSSLGYAPGKKIFRVTDNETINSGIARSFGWSVNSGNSKEYLIQ